MRVVVDTNVFISSFFGGNPRKIINYWLSGKITLCVSKSILKEYFDVLSRFEFDDETFLLRLMCAFEKSYNILFVENPKELQWIKDDFADNKFIACAISLKAEYIVSGDVHLTKIKYIGKIRIVTPLEMNQIIRA